MARKRHRRRSHFGGYITVPSFGSIKEYSPLGKSVNSTDVLVGAGVGLVGGAFVKMGISKLDVATGGKVPGFVKTYVGPISSFVAGVAAYMVQRKKNRNRATGHLVGAALVAASPIVWETLKKAAPNFFNDYVAVSYGALTADAARRSFAALSYDGSEDWDPMSAI